MMHRPILALALCGSLASAAHAGPAPVLPAIVTGASPTPRQATIFEIKFRLPEGQGIAALLVDAGIGSADATEAAKLAAGRCTGLGGCAATVAISRQLASGLRVERLVLVGQSGQTVIERRNGRLALNPDAVTTTK